MQAVDHSVATQLQGATHYSQPTDQYVDSECLSRSVTSQVHVLFHGY